ncbi:hypothetical protein EYF80_002749 [Liparis tanakae]|uniref:Uncharacterized protein n=1 Tax=Liparis tanakae TaxID=230148 RepID=A0A4Z2JAX9_9TELE|nr:hypothetical protein EYF80_002749 [Liparis tanakae]
MTEERLGAVISHQEVEGQLQFLQAINELFFSGGLGSQVEEVDVGFVLLVVLTHQQEDGGVARLIQDRLTHVDCGKREVLQLFLQEHNRGTSSNLTALSVTCRSISWVQILSFESRRTSFLTASSTVSQVRPGTELETEVPFRSPASLPCPSASDSSLSTAGPLSRTLAPSYHFEPLKSKTVNHTVVNQQSADGPVATRQIDMFPH